MLLLLSERHSPLNCRGLHSSMLMFPACLILPLFPPTSSPPLSPPSVSQVVAPQLIADIAQFMVQSGLGTAPPEVQSGGKPWLDLVKEAMWGPADHVRC